jgi:pre-rRNA-processing protein TSR4
MDLEEGMEWGTVLVGTCVNNCGDPGKVSFREEWVGVQWEERVVRK